VLQVGHQSMGYLARTLGVTIMEVRSLSLSLLVLTCFIALCGLAEQPLQAAYLPTRLPAGLRAHTTLRYHRTNAPTHARTPRTYTPQASAKTGWNVHAAFELLARNMMEMHQGNGSVLAAERRRSVNLSVTSRRSTGGAPGSVGAAAAAALLNVEKKRQCC
jgi:hypothetical protein